MGLGQVSQGVPLFRGRRLLLPVPSPACLHRLPLHHGPGRASGPAPVEIRPAATVMLVRDAPEPSGGTTLEVLMVRRNLRSDFVGGAYVFPGGAVDPLDGGAEAEALCAGRTDAGASALLGFDSGGLAYWVAVVRETFEEAGLLLARRDGRPRPAGRGPRGGGALRRRAGRGQRGHAPLPRPVPRRGPAPLGGRHPLLRPLDHPAGRAAPLRHPLLRGRGAAGPDRRPRRRRDDRRGVDLAARRAGPPPRRARSRSSSRPSATSRSSVASPPAPRCSAAAEEASSAVPAIEPRVVPDGNGMRIVLPGDPGYERGAVPDPGERRRARRLQRGGARGLHAGQRGGPRRRARTPPVGTPPGRP